MKFNLILALFFTLMSFSGYAINKQIPEKVETVTETPPDETTVRTNKPQNDRSKGEVRRADISRLERVGKGRRYRRF